MAKKPARGGRVTPKGTQPQSTSKGQAKSQPAIDHRVENRFDPAANQRGSGAHAPTRAGHHRGNR
jgi:hypothetical protein